MGKTKRQQTKIQQQREARYREALRKSGFRSWKRANARRAALIAKSVYGYATQAENQELEQLQTVADLYATWKTNDATGRLIRRLKRTEAKLKR
jgi:hypothetical protein